jgi:nitrogen-specific signal transduction histidine kinase
VSEGKQKGTGLGLTLAHCIALEHGGGVVLLSSKPGETIFQMKVARAVSIQNGADTLVRGPQKEVIENEKVRT